MIWEERVVPLCQMLTDTALSGCSLEDGCKVPLRNINAVLCGGGSSK
jgi:hypothetical protein